MQDKLELSRKHFSFLLLLIVMPFGYNHVLTNISIDSVETRSDSTILKIKYDEKIKYISFFLDQPQRLVIDFEHAKIQGPIPHIPPNDPYIKSINNYNFSTNNLTRLEIKLKKKPSYSLEYSTGELFLKLRKSEHEKNELSTLKSSLKEKDILLDKKDGQIKNLSLKLSKLKGNNKKEEILKHTLQQWIDAWERKDINAYMFFYSPDFESSGKNKKKWGDHKKKIFAKYESIFVQYENIKITVNGNQAKIMFKQKFYADSYSDIGVKSIFLQKEGNDWKIIKELWKP